VSRSHAAREPTVALRIAPALVFLLPPRLRPRAGELAVALDGTSTLVHLLESVGIPRTEVGSVTIDGRPALLDTIPTDGQIAVVAAVARPQPGADRGFLLDVGLGSLARALRLLGLDARYRNDIGDGELVAAAIATGRVVLTQDRGLLRRRALPAGALVRGQGTEAQLADVLHRFAPRLAPWTRCPACNGVLQPAGAETVAPMVEPGTRAAYTQFATCPDCGKVYWRGAHAAPLERRIAAAERAVREARHPGRT
jgi:uncharacterized protein with PIN domain